VRPVTDREPKRVLFVCIENSCRSQIAEAFARVHGQAIIEPYSAGSQPSGHVNPTAIESLTEIGYDLSTHRSKSLAEIPQDEYDIVVTMGCGDACPMVRGKIREDWNIPDPKSMPLQEFKVVRDLIEKRVKELVKKLRR
jgi:arsenate reductase (thioredoxin)